MQPASRKPSTKLATLERGMHILRAFQTNDDGLSNAELSARTGIPKSAVSRLTQTLLELGFLTHAGRKSKFRPGPGLLALGRVANDTLPFVRNSRMTHQRMADETNVQVIMTVREGAYLMLVSARLPQNGSSPFYDVGHRIPIFGSGAGLCYLAALSPSRLSAFIPTLSETYGLSEIEIYKRANDARSALIEDGFYQPPVETYFNSSMRAVALPMRSENLGEPVILSAVVGRQAKTEVELREYIGPKLKQLAKTSDPDLSLVPADELSSGLGTTDAENIARVDFAKQHASNDLGGTE